MARPLASILVLTALSGCIIVDDGWRGFVVYDEYPYGAWDRQEVAYVVYRDYFGVAEADLWLLYNYERYYFLDPIDLYFLLFVATWAEVDFRIVFRTWSDLGWDHHRLVVRYLGTPARFMTVLPPGGDASPLYARLMRWRESDGDLAAGDYRALASMRIGVDFYGHTPASWFQRVAEVGPPHEVLTRDAAMAARATRNVRGQSVAPASRPWDLSPADRAAWRTSVAAKRRENEPSFRQEHAPQVDRYERVRKPKAAPPKW